MIKLSEEQRAILSCYSGTKEEVIEELRKAIPFIEDIELREGSMALLYQVGEISEAVFEDNNRISMIDAYDEE